MARDRTTLGRSLDGSNSCRRGNDFNLGTHKRADALRLAPAFRNGGRWLVAESSHETLSRDGSTETLRNLLLCDYGSIRRVAIRKSRSDPVFDLHRCIDFGDLGAICPARAQTDSEARFSGTFWMVGHGLCVRYTARIFWPHPICNASRLAVFSLADVYRRGNRAGWDCPFSCAAKGRCDLARSGRFRHIKRVQAFTSLPANCALVCYPLRRQKHILDSSLGRCSHGFHEAEGIS